MKRTRPIKLARKKAMKPVFKEPKKQPPLEKVVEAKVRKYALEKGLLVYKFVSPSQRSVPDRIFITPTGVIGFLEMKREGHQPTPKQAHEIAKLTKAGCNASWADTFETGKQFVDDLLRGRNGVAFLQGKGASNQDSVLLEPVKKKLTAKDLI